MRRHYGSLCTEVYDLTKPVDGTYADVPYYRARLAAVDGPVLEAGVGTGRLLIPLLRGGVDVEGLDPSGEMLDCCRRNCSTAGVSPVLYQGTLEATPLSKRYAAVVVTFGSLMLFAHAGEARAALAASRRVLVPGGLLYVDVNVPKSRIDLGGVRKRVGAFATPEGDEITLDRQATWDPVERLESTVLFYEKIRAGAVVAREEQDFPLRWWEQDELTPAAARRWWCLTARSR